MCIQESFEVLSVPSEDRKIPVKLHYLDVPGLTIYVENEGQASYFKYADKALHTFTEKTKWKEKHPYKFWLWNLGIGGKPPWAPYPED